MIKENPRVTAQREKPERSSSLDVKRRIMITSLFLSSCQPIIEGRSSTPTSFKPRLTETAPLVSTPTLLPTPTETPTAPPIPTEVPRYDGELVNLDYMKSRGWPEIAFFDNDMFAGNFWGHEIEGPIQLTLVREYIDPETSITEHIWGFTLDGRRIFSKTNAVSKCWFPTPRGNIEIIGQGVENLHIGYRYNVFFYGLVEPLPQQTLYQVAPDGSGRDMTPACRSVWGNLRIDSEDQERFRRFFQNGETEGFEVDEEGVIDLTRVVTPWLIEKYLE